MYMFNDKVKRNLVKRFPSVELSYAKTLHNKVHANYYMIIPKGPKAFMWFTYVDHHNVCVILNLNAKGNVCNINIRPICFEKELSYGTVIYGTTLSINSQDYFTCEDLHYYKGKNVSKYAFKDKLNLLEHMFTDDVSQISYNNHFNTIRSIHFFRLHRDTKYGRTSPVHSLLHQSI